MKYFYTISTKVTTKENQNLDFPSELRNMKNLYHSFHLIFIGKETIVAIISQIELGK